jgi:hypothetical protein
MRYRALVLTAATFLTAAAASAQASRAVRVLAASDSSLPAMAVAAAKVIAGESRSTVRFGGVFVGSREAKPATDSVIAATQWEKADNRVPFVVCRQGTSCPEAEEARGRVAWTMVSFRATDDSAYVGAEATSAAQGSRSHCVTLVRSGSAWVGSAISAIPSARRCGQ